MSFQHSSSSTQNLPGCTSGKEFTRQCRRHRKQGFDPRVGKIPWRRKQQPSPVFFLPVEFHRQRSLAGYCPRGHKESDTTEHTHSSSSTAASHWLPEGGCCCAWPTGLPWHLCRHLPGSGHVPPLHTCSLLLSSPSSSLPSGSGCQPSGSLLAQKDFSRKISHPPSLGSPCSSGWRWGEGGVCFLTSPAYVFLLKELAAWAPWVSLAAGTQRCRVSEQWGARGRGGGWGGGPGTPLPPRTSSCRVLDQFLEGALFHL